MPSSVTDRLAGANASVAVKAPCRAATTAPIMLTGDQTIDGIAVAAGDRVLVKDQTDARQNGIWMAAASNWSRARDFDGARDVVSGTLVPINEGMLGGGFLFKVTTANPIAVGDAELTFAASTFTDLAVSAFWQGILAETTRAAALAALGAEAAFAKGADIASAATLVLGTDGNFFHVTGSTGPITAVTVPAGLLFILVFASTPQLNHHTTNLNLPTEANIVAEAGDRLIGFSTAANQVTVLAYQRASGRPLIEDATFEVAASDEVTAITAGTSKITFRMPFAMKLNGIRASLGTAQTSGSILTIDINEGGTTILSTKLTIDNTERTSTTALNAAVISDPDLADDAEISIDVDQVGDGTAKGLKVTFIGRKA
jgi:hypothetical protein